MPRYYIATFHGARGRYLVEEESPGCYGGQRITNKRQEKYGNKPDSATGLYLNEMYRMFDAREIKTIKPFTRRP